LHQRSWLIPYAELRTIRKLQPICRTADKCTADRQLGIAAKDNAIGIEQKQIGSAIGAD
jgi:hypothetical protein